VQGRWLGKRGPPTCSGREELSGHKILCVGDVGDSREVNRGDRGPAESQFGERKAEASKKNHTFCEASMGCTGRDNKAGE